MTLSYIREFTQVKSLMSIANVENPLTIALDLLHTREFILEQDLIYAVNEENPLARAVT